MKAIITTLLLACLTLTAQARKPKVIETPQWISSNTGKNLTITRVEFTDTATVLWFHSKYKPKNWIRISRNSTLTDDRGRRYKARCGIGIKLSKRFYMPASGEADFKVSFEPLPRNTRAFDFIESPADWKIWGIHAPGEELPQYTEATYRADSALRQTDEAAFFRRGTGVVCGRFHGKRPGLVNYYGYDAITSGSYPQVFDVAADGSFTATIPVECPTLADLSANGRSLYFYLSAGDTIRMDITEDGTVRYADGTKHRKLLTMLSNYDPEMATDYYRMAALADSLPFSGYARAVAEGAQKQLDFAEYLIHKHKLDAREAHLLRTKTRLGCCQYINPMTDEEPDTTALGPLNAANYAFMRSMGLEDLTCLSLPFELYVLQNRYEYCDLMFHNPVWSNLALSIKVDDDTRIARDEALFGLGRPSLLLQLTWLAKRRYAEIQYPRDSIATSKLIDRRISLMRSPYLSSRLADMKRELENPKAATYALPEGRAAALFDSIVAPYRGKTVIVDFWSTSCGPCVAEIKASQQLRDSIAAMPGVELLFITSDQQTPAKAYADFKAKHLASEESCRIPHDDWQRLMALFKFTGIPHKETVTPSGRIARTQIRRFHHLDGSLREIRRIAASLSGL